jgi:hypothetical protein
MLDPARTDQRIAAVLRGREHHLAAALQPAQRSPQIRRGQHRAVGADEERRASRLRERAIHALAQVFSLLHAQRNAEGVEESMPSRGVDLDRPAARSERGLHRVPRQSRLQLRRAPLAQARHQARLGLSRDRRTREHDDHFS